MRVYLIHWNAPEWCESAARSIAAAGGDVTVIHNGGRVPGVDRVIVAGANGGYTGGANIAIRDWLATGDEWCVIGSHDLHVESDTFEAMLAVATPNVGIIGPVLTDLGPAPRELLRVEGRREIRTWVSGTCLMLRRSCVEQVGEFDEHFGSYHEEVDYCRRATDRGWIVVRALEARAHGIGSASSTVWPRIYSNEILFEFKHGGTAAAARRWTWNARCAARALIDRDWTRLGNHAYALVVGPTKALRYTVRPDRITKRRP